MRSRELDGLCDPWRVRWTLLGVFSLGAIALGAARGVEASPGPAVRVLVFSKTSGFRHDSIADGLTAIEQLGRANGFGVDATEDGASFTADNLAGYGAVVFLSTTGDVLTPEQQAAFEDYIRNGGGYVGIHSASDTEYDWPWYGGLVGAYFLSHPAPQDATLLVEDRTHESTTHLGDTWQRFDEWYDFRDNPRARVHVLVSVDPATLAVSQMPGDHPIAWCHDYDGGRAWYTALGHTAESWTEPEFLQHVLGGIRSAAGITTADCSALIAPDPVTATPPTTGQTTSVAPATSPAPTTTTTAVTTTTADGTASPSASPATSPLATTTRNTTDSATSDDPSAAPWVVLSVVAGTAALGGVAFAIVRRRRQSR
jgi:type 1 glutamine amidotransferase